MMSFRHTGFTIFTAAVVTLAACSPNTTSPRDESASQVIIPSERFFTADQFTYANYQEVVVKHAALDLDVNFDRKVLDGAVTLQFERLQQEAQTLTLDTKDLLIKAVAIETEDGWLPAKYTLADADPVLGSAMRISIGREATQLRIIYETSPSAEGLQWLTPAQTAGKEKPYLSQCRNRFQVISSRLRLVILNSKPSMRPSAFMPKTIFWTLPLRSLRKHRKWKSPIRNYTDLTAGAAMI